MALTQISGTLAGSVKEDLTFKANGTVFITGAGSTVGTFDSGVFPGVYGTLTIDANGAWSYALNNSSYLVQGLTGNAEVHDQFGISWGFGFTRGVIDIIVQGANDPATIEGDLAQSLSVFLSTSFSGKLDIFDPDIGEKQFVSTTKTGKFGTFALDIKGAWTYALAPGEQTAFIDESKEGIDSFGIFSVDGTPATVSISVGSFAGAIVGTTGNDTIAGGPGNNSIDGSAGIDTAVYSGNKGAYTINLGSSSTSLSTILDKRATLPSDGKDSLKNVERLQFTDANVAIDLNGHAGQAAKLLGAVFGVSAVTNKQYVGIALSLLDGGMSYEQLATAAIGVTGKTSNSDAATLLWTNLFGLAPTPNQIAPVVAILDQGMSVGTFTVLVAESSFNADHINLVGLSQAGIEFV